MSEAASQDKGMHLKYSDDYLKRLCNENERLATYDKWPLHFISKELLAKNGFFYKGENDSAICIYCGIEIGQWEEGDDPVEEHKKFSPTCSTFHASTDTSTIKSEDECGCVINTRKNKKKNYTSLDARFCTYKDWPISLKQAPKDMALAGFYYTGKSDKVICFSCGLGLNKWTFEDDPWIEHAKWNPECRHLKEKKGEDFIEKIQSETFTKEDIEKNDETKNSFQQALVHEQLLCSVCKIEQRSVVSLPCRHFATCKSCNSKLIECPICKQKKEEALSIYVP